MPGATVNLIEEHNSLIKKLKDLPKDKINKSKRFYELVEKQDYTKALLHACQYCKSGNEIHLKAIEILLSYEFSLKININKSSAERKTCLDYAVINKNQSLLRVLNSAGARPNAVPPRSIVNAINDHQFTQRYLRVHDVSGYQHLLELFLNTITFPSKFEFEKDDENSKFDLNRINAIIKIIDHLGKLQFDLSDFKISTDEKELFEKQVLNEAKELFQFIAIHVFNLSKNLREQYESHFQPAPFNWYTLEQFATMSVIVSEKLRVDHNFGPHTARASQETFSALMDFKAEIEHRKDIFEAAIPIIIKNDFPALREFFLAIRNNLDSSIQRTVQPVHLLTTKAVITHLHDNMSLHQLLNLVYMYFNDTNQPEIEAQRHGTVNQIVKVPANVILNHFVTKHGLFATIRRLQLIGELLTGKNFSRLLTDLDTSVDWHALVSIRDHTVHQDQEDFRQRAAFLFTDPTILENVSKELNEEFGDIIVRLIVAKHKITGGFKLTKNTKKFTTQYVDKIQDIFNKHSDAIKLKEQEGKEKSKIVQTEYARVTNEEESRFIGFLNDHNNKCENADDKIEPDLMAKILKILRGTTGKTNIIKGKDSGKILRPFAKLGRTSSLAIELKGIWEKALASYETTVEQRVKHSNDLTQQRHDRIQAQGEMKKGLPHIRALAARLQTPIDPEHPIDNSDHISAAMEAIENIKGFLTWVGFDMNIFLNEEYQDNIDFLLAVVEQYPFIKQVLEYHVTQFSLHVEKIMQFIDPAIMKPSIATTLRAVRNFLEHGIAFFEKLESKTTSLTDCYHDSARMNQLVIMTHAILYFMSPEMSRAKERLERHITEEMKSPVYKEWFQNDRNLTRAELAMYMIALKNESEHLLLQEEPNEDLNVTVIEKNKSVLDQFSIFARTEVSAPPRAADESTQNASIPSSRRMYDPQTGQEEEIEPIESEEQKMITRSKNANM